MREMGTVCLLEGRPYEENPLLISVLKYFILLLFSFFPTLKPRFGLAI